MSSEPTAVCVLVFQAGRVLSVSRKGDPLDRGLPGGKVEPGEAPEDAAVRECREETGYDVRIVREVYRAQCDDHLCVTYLAKIIGGKPGSDESGVVSWVSLDQIMAHGCSFAEYNRGLRDAYVGLRAAMHPIGSLVETVSTSIGEWGSGSVRVQRLFVIGHGDDLDHLVTEIPPNHWPSPDIAEGFTERLVRLGITAAEQVALVASGEESDQWVDAKLARLTARSVYQLRARGDMISFDSRRDLRSSTVFLDRDVAEDKRDRMRELACGQHALLALDPKTVEVTVEELEIID